MGETYPPEYLEFFARFNQCQYWEAHEILEQLWIRADHDPFYQGLIVLAAAYVHIYDKNNPSGARKCLLNVKRFLAGSAPDRMGVDVAGILAHADGCLDRLAGLPAGARLLDHIPLLHLEPGRAIQYWRG